MSLGRVGEQTFVNNGSVGLYPLLVRELLFVGNHRYSLEAVGERRSTMGIALGGEVMEMKLPWRFEVLPCALRVVAARAPAGRAALPSRMA